MVNQPIDRRREDKFLFPITLIKSDYFLDFTNLSNILANFKLEIKVNYGEFSAIPFNLLNSNYYLRKGGNLIEEKFLYVENVKYLDTKEIPFVHLGDILTVIFPQKFKKGDIIKLSISYGGNAFEPTPAMSYYINLTGLDWFPNPLQGYESIECLFSGKIKCKKPFYPFASFDFYEIKEEEDIVKLEGKSKFPSNYHSIAVGKYFIASKKVLDKFNITVASTVFPNKRAYNTLFGLSEGILEFYEYF